MMYCIIIMYENRFKYYICIINKPILNFGIIKSAHWIYCYYAEESSPSKVQGVTVTRTVQGSSPALRVSWSAVSGSGITYTVCYSTTSETQSNPPSGADCSTSGLTGMSTTLGSLSSGTIYYIWVNADFRNEQGPYSDRVQKRACYGE